MLDEHILGSDSAYLCGNAMTIADYYAAPFVALGGLVGSDYVA